MKPGRTGGMASLSAWRRCWELGRHSMAFMLLALQVRRSWALWSSCGGRRVRLHRGMIHRAEDIRYTGGPLAEERSETKFEALRLRAVTGDAEGRRAAFFRGANKLTQLEKATTAALRAIALGDSLGAAACESLEDALSKLDMSQEASRSYAEALREAVRSGAVLQDTLRNTKGTFASALGRLSAEVEASKVDVDFCLSLADRILPESAYSATRELNALSNRLLRAASYGFKADVREARRALSDYAAECATLSPEARAYVEALTSLSASEAETAIVEAALSTFFDQKPTTLTDRLGDAFSVALQRFLGELMRRGAIAGRKPAEPTTIAIADDPSPPFTMAGRSKPLGFNFVEWEMRLRRDLAIGREEPGTALRPRDFVGKWKLVFVDDSNPQPLAVKTIDLLADNEALDVIFQADGQVNAPPSPFTTKSQPSAKWIVRPGPAHLDTCEFELVLPDTIVAFCGYVDRGQRIESRFSRRPIKVSGFAFQKDKTSYRPDADANDQQRDSQPSGRFAM